MSNVHSLILPMSWARKLWKQQGIQGAWKSKQTMAKVGLYLNSKDKTWKAKTITQSMWNKSSNGFYFDNRQKHEHEKKWTRQWCKNIFQTCVE